MECLSQETVSFSDVMGQLHDMLNPEVWVVVDASDSVWMLVCDGTPGGP